MDASDALLSCLTSTAAGEAGHAACGHSGLCPVTDSEFLPLSALPAPSPPKSPLHLLREAFADHPFEISAGPPPEHPLPCFPALSSQNLLYI